MKNSLQDLNNYLFESLERINDDDLTDEELEKEIKRSEAVTKVASTIINNAEVQALTIHSPAAASAAISASVSAAAPLLRTPELHPDISVNAVSFPDVADIEEQLRRNLMKQLVRSTEV